MCEGTIVVSQVSPWASVVPFGATPQFDPFEAFTLALGDQGMTSAVEGVLVSSASEPMTSMEMTAMTDDPKTTWYDETVYDGKVATGPASTREGKGSGISGTSDLPGRPRWQLVNCGYENIRALPTRSDRGTPENGGTHLPTFCELHSVRWSAPTFLIRPVLAGTCEKSFRVKLLRSSSRSGYRDKGETRDGGQGFFF